MMMMIRSGATIAVCRTRTAGRRLRVVEELALLKSSSSRSYRDGRFLSSMTTTTTTTATTTTVTPNFSSQNKSIPHPHPSLRIIRQHPSATVGVGGDAMKRMRFSSAATVTDDSDDDDSSLLTPFLLADIGEGIKEVELMQWFVQPGDTVQQFDRICEVQSDKATVEITSRFDGKVDKLNGDVGDMIQVGDALLYLSGVEGGSGTAATAGGGGGGDTVSEEEENVAVAAANRRMLQDDEDHPEPDQRLHIPTIASHYDLETDNADTTAAAMQSDDNDGDSSDFDNGKFLASPAVRKLGKEYKVNLATIHPSGPHGRLLKSDVVTYLKEQGLWKKTQKKGAVEDDATSSSSHEKGEEEKAQASSPVVSATDGDDEIVQLKGYHRLMVQTMTEALKIPHMCFSDELVVNELVKFRHKLKERDIETNVSLLAFFIKAASLAITEYPIINASVHDAEKCQIRVHGNHDIGIAVDTPRGLVVPVIRKVQTKTLLEIQTDLNELKIKARDSKLKAEDLEKATFTLSNIGSIGGTYMQPVILPPQMAMGAFGRVQRLPRFKNDNSAEIEEAQVMHVSWAGDHRFLDGATLARFHASFKKYVENPTQMLVQMK